MEVARLGVEKGDLELAGRGRALGDLCAALCRAADEDYLCFPFGWNLFECRARLMRVRFGHPIPLGQQVQVPGHLRRQSINFTRDQSLSTRDRFLWCCSPRLPREAIRYDSCGEKASEITITDVSAGTRKTRETSSARGEGDRS